MPLTERRLVGEVFAGNFKIEAQLGRGAMGEVYLAEQMSLGKKVAIKVLHRHLQGDEGILKRFHREAKAASSLNHPNSLQVIDFGQSADGELFIAMELVQGRDLARLLTEEEFPLPLPRVVRILSQVLAALDEAHALGIIHRDLKPENVMIVDRRGERDFVKVCDFGIAKIQDPKSDSGVGTITMAGMVCGTPEYMSPEQCRGEKLDGRSDLYSAGVILYQMTTGELPFTAESALGIVTKHLTETPLPPGRRRTDPPVDPRLEAIIVRSLSKHREARFPTAQAMREALESLVRPSGDFDASASTAAVRTGRNVVVAETYSSDELLLDAETKTNRWKWAAAACLPLLVMAIVLAVRGNRSGTLHRQSASDAQKASVGDQKHGPSPKAAPRPQRLGPDAPGSGVQPGAKEASKEDAPAIVQHAATAQGRNEAASGQPGANTERRRRAAAPKRAAVPVAAPQEKAAPATPSSGATPAEPPASPSVLAFREGKRLLDHGSVREAIAKFLEAVRHDGAYAPAYKALGQAHMRLGQTDEGKRYYRRYLEFKPDDPFVRAIVER